jgi:Zn-finger nucleic acid-binding protein
MKGYIYLIQSNELNYIGSTPRKVEYRITEHKRKGLFKLYDMNPNNYTLKILEEIDYNKKIELRTREQYYIDNYDCVNKIRAVGLSRKEYDKILYNKNKDKRIKQASEYQKTEKSKLKRQERYKYQSSWGGDKQYNNNLLQININIFN